MLLLFMIIQNAYDFIPKFFFAVLVPSYAYDKIQPLLGNVESTGVLIRVVFPSLWLSCIR